MFRRPLILLCILSLLAPPWAFARNTHGAASIGEELMAILGDLSPPGTVEGCYHATSGTTAVSLASCRAYVRNSSTGRMEYLEETTARTITYSGGDGTYWLIAHSTITDAVSGWTRVAGTHYLWQLSASKPTIPSQGTLLEQSTVSGAAITAVIDQRQRRLLSSETISVNHTIGPYASWSIPMDVSVSVNAGITLTFQSQARLTAGTYRVFAVTETGRVSLPPSIVVRPVWFTTSGTGSTSDRWTATDGSGGFRQAFNALNEHGVLEADAGDYSMGTCSGTNFTGDTTVCAGFDLANVLIDFGKAHLVGTASARWFDLNTGANAADSSTNNINVKVSGGFFDSGSENNTSAATVFTARRLRDVIIENWRTRGMNVGIDIPSADTITIRGGFCRRTTTCILIPDFLNTEGVTPQDIYIYNNSITANITSIFVDVNSVVDSLNIYNNGWHCETSDCRFASIVTGTAEGDSGNVRIWANATESATDATLIHVFDTGSTNTLVNLSIRNNSLASTNAVAIDVERISGLLEIKGNHCTDPAADCIIVDALQGSAVAIVEENIFDQTTASTPDGTQFTFTNTVSTAHIIIGRNSFDHTDIAGRVYPAANTMFTHLQNHFANLTSAATITIEPDSRYFNLTGTTTVNTINPTWRGHCISIRMNTTAQLADGVGNIALSAAGPNTADDTISLCASDTTWYETGRSVN